MSRDSIHIVLCLDCGRVAKFSNYGVTLCSERNHHRMANRDVLAAKKIGARYLASKKGLNLGPWILSVFFTYRQGETTGVKIKA